MNNAEKADIPEIEKARMAAAVFLKRTLGVENVKVTKLGKVGDGWEIEAEVYEESSFIKALGLASKVRDRNIYSIKMDIGLEIQSYEKLGQA
jgi:hypothetical protein